MAKTMEQILAAAKAAGVEVTVTQHPKGTGEVVRLPGLRQSRIAGPPVLNDRRADLLQDDDDSGVVAT